jgi:hypothetical protein
MKEGKESYLVPYTSATLDYNTIQVTIVNLVDCWVVLVYSLGLFSSGLGRLTPAHSSRIFGLVRGKVWSKLSPMVMAPMAGLVPWLRIQKQLESGSAYLMPLASGTARTIQVPAAPSPPG